jgi:heptosyltransferase-1
VARNRQLAALALGYPVPETPPDYGIGIKATNNLAILPAPAYVVGLHGTSRDSKLWPVAHWIALSQSLAEQGLSLLLPWGNASEHLRAQAIAEKVPTATVLPKLGIKALTTILAGAQAAVGVDTGLVHLAVALKLPTVAIYTDTNPELTGVYPAAGAQAVNLGGKAKVPTPDNVKNTLLSLLSRTSNTPI